MNIHFLQHESFEDLASINNWAEKPGNKVTSTRFFEEKFTLPDIEDFDLLIVLGGPMGVYDEDRFPWLKVEKKFIAEAIKKEKKVLGICLGSQLLAEVLGARVYKHTEKEIGWLDVHFTSSSKDDFFFHDFPSDLKVFQWHGDTFDLPNGATHIAFSEGCKHQAFTYKNHVVAVQFHMEATTKLVDELIINCREELTEGKYIQKESAIISDTSHLPTMNNYMVRLLEKMK